MSDNGRKTIELPEFITVRDLAAMIEISPIDIIKQLMANGMMANINQQIDFDTAALVIDELGYDAEPLTVVEETSEDESAGPEWRQRIAAEAAEDLKTRPPVVTIMGHVDHGKTSLLDVIRGTGVAEQEAGGITQHIGAYQVTHNNYKITFLDTPGHAAFTAMRARGAQATDIAILVVAADDGVMPQTREAAAHAKAAKVPVVVALNKIDRSNANPDVVKKQLSEIDLTPDEWDGDTIVVPVSAKERTGIEDLLEAILLVADDNDILANPNADKVSGTVIEARIEKSRGVMITLLVQNGTLRVGDAVIIGTVSGRIRAMFDYEGKKIESAEPSMPVSIMGLPKVPEAGELFETVKSTSLGRRIASERKDALAEQKKVKRQTFTLDQMFAAFRQGKAEELNLVVKADVQGSLEPIVKSLENLGNKELKVRLIYSGVGNINESDILLASTSKAIAIGFNVEPDRSARSLAATNGVDIRTYDVIYRLTEDIEKALKGKLGPEYTEVQLGKAEVRATFKASRKLGTVAGCRIQEGELRRNAKVRVLRGSQVVHEGTVTSLRRGRDDVREVRQGFECGIGVDGYNDWEIGDIIAAYEIVEVEPV